ncbi:hypothetical protein IKZ70_06610 [bacterium]|nr:hypothetical protein [bacterium]
MTAPLCIIPGDALKDIYPDGAPMRETMIAGPSDSEVFSPAFIKARAAYHNESEAEYANKVIGALPQKAQLLSEDLTLIFGFEAFCQMNLLTILAYLAQLGRELPVTIKLIDEFKGNQELRSFAFSDFQNAEHWYKTLLIDKKAFKSDPLLWPEMKKAAALFLTLQEEQNEITDIIDENSALSETALVKLLLTWDKDYGLSDELFLDLIRKRRSATK